MFSKVLAPASEIKADSYYTRHILHHILIVMSFTLRYDKSVFTVRLPVMLLHTPEELLTLT